MTMQAPVKRPESQLAQWGSIGFYYRRAWQSFDKQIPAALRTGSEVDRSSLEGAIKGECPSLSGGLLTDPRIHNWQTNLDKLYYNQGIQHHRPGTACHCYALTTQETLLAVDVSGYRAANLAMHGFNTNKGQSKLRFGVAVGPRIYVTTDDTDHSLVARYTGTNNIMCYGEIILNSVRYPAFGTDGQTQNTFGVADISANPLVPTTLITHAADDVGNGMVNLNLAGLGFNAHVGRYTTDGLFYTKHTDTIPIASAAMKAIVKTSTKNEPNASATVLNTGALSFRKAMATTDELGPAWVIANPTNVLASDNAYATLGNGASTAAGTNWLIVLDPDLSSLPDTAFLTGIKVEVERHETADVDNAFDLDVFLCTGINVTETPSSLTTISPNCIGENKAYTTEWPTATDTYYAYPPSATDDMWASGLVTGADIKTGSFGLAYRWYAADGDDANIDHIRITIYYTMPGTSIDLPVGGRSWGLMPTDTSVWMLTVPESDELTTVVQRRKAAYVDFDYDSDGQRVTAEVSYPNTMGLSHVEWIAGGLGGAVMAGDNSSGLPTALRLIRGDGEPVDLRVPTTYNGKACGPVNGWCQGRFILLEMAFADVTDTQLWYYFDSKYYASNLVQSLSGTTPPNAMDALPLSWVGEPIGTELRRWYRGFPVADTHLAVSRCFLPRDLLSDPLTTNTSEAKYEGELYALSPEMNFFGPTEALKTLNVIQYQGRQISTTGGAYGSIRCKVDTGGDRTFASAEADTGDMTTAFATFNVPSSGISIGPDKTVIFRYSIDNTGAPTKTPNLLPLLYTGFATWRPQRVWNFELDTDRLSEGNEDWESWLQRILDQQATKAVQPLQVGNRLVPASLKDTDLILLAATPTTGAKVDTTDGRTPPKLSFAQKLGTTAA